MTDVTATVMERTFTELDQPLLSETSSRIAEIAQRNRDGRVWTVVLDDDPTGTQTVQAVPVLTADFSVENFEWASTHPSGIVFALTNSRSGDATSADDLTYRIVRTAAAVASRHGRRLRIVSRSDSTLRGHFATELAAAHRALKDSGVATQGTVFVPAFLEAGRLTAQGIQWVESADRYVPAAATEFAQDATFGYEETQLLDWVTARTTTPPLTITLDTLRQPGSAERVAGQVLDLTDEQVVIAEAVRPEDLETLMLGVLTREEQGQRVVIRSGPSFVRVCAGQLSAAPVAPTGGTAGHGLVVVGSHTALTNTQVHDAQQHHGLTLVELDAQRIVDGGSGRDNEIARCRQAAQDGLNSQDVLLHTSRVVITSGRADALSTSRAVADALVEVVRNVATTSQLKFLVAKGGITSSDMAVRALDVTRTLVIGQMLPGTIPVWELLDGLKPGMPYVVFPGNVGGSDALTEVLTKVTK